MKGIGVKRLVAIAAGAALIGSAVAPFVSAAVSDVTKDHVYNADGSPKVNLTYGNVLDLPAATLIDLEIAHGSVTEGAAFCTATCAGGTEGGVVITDIPDGESKSSEDGLTIVKVTKVNYTVEATTEGEVVEGADATCSVSPSTYTMPASDNERGRVYMTGTKPSTPLVVVGGPAANPGALLSLYDKLTQAGDGVVEVLNDGAQVVVARYSSDGADTLTQAEKVVDLIKS